ncbi:sugar ABC transporter ATP-binding protein [Actinobaculum suis]|uniref:sugar ABC transporter ATP-binding protein n=1 Tax=Actinobaculum suis TaxID=1657 RepID=UPI00080A5E66|nr:sugar ABC transporter ATP-binding protein [Actinobaculum suis]OCA93577.1 ABC transporter ATP-binding protein [Actinobaculum suis]
MVAGLVAKGLRKDYSGVEVLKGVSLELHPGEIVGLVGHNGAGKSTLLKIFSGAHVHSGGTLSVNGEPVSFSSPSDAISAGVSTVYQELSLLPNLTVSQNIWLGRELRKFGKLQLKEMGERARDILDRFGMQVDPNAKVGSYPMATRQLLEIAIAASKETRYLLLDEPTTSLEGEQIDRLLDYVKNLAKRNNIGVLIVSHKLDELYKVADRIVALMDGRIVVDADARTVDRTQVIRAIAGGEALKETKKEPVRVADFGQEALAVEDLRSEKLSGVSFSVREGEILGIYGLNDSGRTETLRTLAGLLEYDSGTMRVFGEPYSPRRPSDAIAASIAFVTEERKYDGIVPLMNAYQNLTLPVLNKFKKAGFLDLRALKKRAIEELDNLELRGNPSNPVSSLSGGNQQKVVLGRALIQSPRILLLDEPTKGVDIGVKAEIYRLLRHLARDRKMSIVFVSSEEEEVLSLSDTVLVLAHGSPVGSAVQADDLSQGKLRELSWTE